MSGDGLYPGIAIGCFIGAGGILLIISLLVAATDRAEARQIRKIRESGGW